MDSRTQPTLSKSSVSERNIKRKYEVFLLDSRTQPTLLKSSGSERNNKRNCLLLHITYKLSTYIIHTMSITTHNLAIGYDKKTVATNLNAEFKDGELTCLLGPNGIGKSTFLRTIMGIQPPLAGDIIYNNGGKDMKLKNMSQKDIARMVSIVLTDKPDVGNITVEEIVSMGRNPYTGFWGTLNEEDKQIVEKTVDIVGLSRYMKTPIGQLSDGEQQKIMTAKALAQETPIILLDEPTSFLDFQSKVEMMKLLRDLAHDMEKTIVLSTHDLMLAEKMGDKLWWMESTLQPISKDRLANYLTDVLDTTVERTRML